MARWWCWDKPCPRKKTCTNAQENHGGTGWWYLDKAIFSQGRRQVVNALYTCTSSYACARGWGTSCINANLAVYALTTRHNMSLCHIFALISCNGSSFVCPFQTGLVLNTTPYNQTIHYTTLSLPAM